MDQYKSMRSRMSDDEYIEWLENMSDDFHFSFRSLKSFVIDQLEQIDLVSSSPIECHALIQKVIKTVKDYK